MINKIKCTATLLFVTTVLSTPNLCAQTFEWAKSMGGANFDRGNAIAADGAGNVYTTGRFLGPADFDPGPGVVTLTSFGVQDAFIQKLDANGDLVWVKRIGGADETESHDITIDISGNIYVTGSFEGTVDFDPGTGVSELTSAGSSDIFILKLDGNGDFIWAKRVGGTSGDVGVSIGTDAFGNSYTSGSFRSTVDFDPGSGNFDLSSQGSEDIYVLKLDAGGNFLWARQMGGSSLDEAVSLAADGGGNVYTIGTFASTADFDPGPGTFNLTSSTSGWDIFVSKIDVAGNFVWAKQFEGNGLEFPYAIEVDQGGNVYTAGHFIDTMDVDPGAGTNELINGDWDIFVVKLDATGNLAWANQIGGFNIQYCYDLAIDGDQNVYTTGEFRETVDFDPGPGVDELTAEGTNSDIFVQKFDAFGNHVWAQSMGGSADDKGFGIAARGGNVYTTGRYSDTADFDPGAGIFDLVAVGSADCFVHKIGESSNSISESESGTQIAVYPNPSNGVINVSFENTVNTVSITLTDLKGKELYSRELNSAHKEQLNIETTPGVYLLKIITPTSQKVFRIVMD